MSLVPLVLLIALLPACTSNNENGGPVATVPTATQQPDADPNNDGGATTPSSQSPTEEDAMKKRVTSGSIPGDLDPRLERRDTSPLPPEALVRFQLINRGKNPRPNYRWVLYEDGRLFLARHSGDTSGDYRTPFDTELPAKPTEVLSPDAVNEVKEQLDQARFLGQAPYYLDPTVDDGGSYVVTARINGKVHEVIYEAYSPPLVKFLSTIAPD
ncbi:MAG TPA: hypothetical protein VGE45_14420 [Chloroflexia bacterium]